MTTARIELPPKLIPVFTPPRGALRYRGAYGGRGSAKSRSFASMASVFGMSEKLRILCVREYQNSIKESFHAELKTAIYSKPWLSNAFDVGVDYLRGKNGTEFIFKGLQKMSTIKSMSDIDLCIVEEAEDSSENSWRELIPTIRKPGSEIWAIWNPKLDGSPTDIRFKKNTPPRSMIVEMNWRDNPVFKDTALHEERLNDLEIMDRATYLHVWEGDYLKNSEAQIFRNKYRVQEFTPGKFWDGPYHGLDWGFSQDPTAANRVWVFDDKLWIEYEASKVGLELDDTADFIKENIPGVEKYTIRADNARPESISFVKRHGLPLIEGVDKWKGSVEDGIEHMKSYREIVIHPRCPKTLKEFDLYSFKVDRLSGDILPIIVDAHNHHIDDIRYAINPLIKSGFTNYGAIL